MHVLHSCGYAYSKGVWPKINFTARCVSRARSIEPEILLRCCVDYGEVPNVPYKFLSLPLQNACSSSHALSARSSPLLIKQ